MIINRNDLTVGSVIKNKDLYVMGNIYKKKPGNKIEKVGNVTGPAKTYKNVVPVFANNECTKLKNTSLKIDCFGNVTIPNTGSLTIQQNNIDKGYVLVSDSTGKGRWKDLTKLDVITFRKDEQDTRIKHIYLNDRGKKIFTEIFEIQKKRIYNALLSSSSEEVINFDNVLKKIING